MAADCPGWLEIFGEADGFSLLWLVMLRFIVAFVVLGGLGEGGLCCCSHAVVSLAGC